MSVTRADDRGNQVIYESEALSDNLKVIFSGSSNTLRIGKDVSARGRIRLEFTSNEGEIVLADGCALGSGTIRVCHSSRINLGGSVSITRSIFMEASEGASIDIGEDSMIASDVILRASDGHAIFDATSGERINHSQPITIGRHVWIGDRAIILGGANIGDGSIIGAGSVVKASVPDQSVAVGSPARVVRSGVVWSRQGLKRMAPGKISHLSKVREELQPPTFDLGSEREDTRRVSPATITMDNLRKFIRRPLARIASLLRQ